MTGFVFTTSVAAQHSIQLGDYLKSYGDDNLKFQSNFHVHEVWIFYIHLKTWDKQPTARDSALEVQWLQVVVNIYLKL